MTLGEFIRTKRKEQGITQKQLADYAEVSYTLVNRIENGDERLQLATLNKILGVFAYQVGPVPAPRSELFPEVSDD